jgi:PAS domain S-box-containing protein
MFRFTPGPPRVVAVGVDPETVRGLSGTTTRGGDVDVETVARSAQRSNDPNRTSSAASDPDSTWKADLPRTVVEDIDGDVDCVVVGASVSDPAGVVDAVGETHEVPVVALVDGATVAETLSAGVTDHLPPSVAADRPDLVADRIVDVVDREHARRGLREVYDGVSGTVSLHDTETGRMVHANERLCDLLGYDREELLSMRVGEFTADHPDYDHDRAMEVITTAADRGPDEDPVVVEWPLETATGETRWVESELTTASVGGRTVVLSSSTDVTGRREDRRRIEEEREKYSTLVEQSTDGVAVVEGGGYDFVNRRFVEITGYDREELLSMPFEEVFAPEYRDLVRERYERRLAGESVPDRYDVEIETPEGDRLTLDLAVSRISHDDRPATMASFRDVTERKRRQRAVERLQEATERIQDASTPEAVAETTVTALGEVLDLSTVACFFHDESTRTLRPVAHDADADAVPGSEVTVTFDPGEEVYEVFESGTATRYAPDEGVLGPMSSMRLAFPVGDHGVLVAGHEEETAVDEVLFDVARTLVEHAETALERVDRAAAVRESERRFRLIADRIDQAIYLTNLDLTEVHYVNAAHETVTGDPVDDLYEDVTALGARVHPDDRDRLYEAVGSMVDELTDPSASAADSYEFEWRIERADGEVRHLRGVSYPVLTDRSDEASNGDPDRDDRLVSVVEDVTERKRRQREYEQIFDGVTDAISVHDPETGDILTVNETYVDLFGYDRDAVRDLGVDGLSVTEAGYTADRSREIVREVAATGETVTVEWQVETADGDRRWAEVKTTPATINGERRVLGISRDVTERKRRQREYEQVFNGVHDIINVYDPETKDLVSVNDRTCEVTGYDRETILDGGIELISATEEGYTEDRSAAVVEEVVASGDPREIDWMLETADGDHVQLEVSATPAEINGEDRLLTIARDVTERKRTERQLRTVAERVDEVIYVASPDLREVYYLSPGYEEIWGQPVDRMYDDPEAFTSVTHPEDRESVREWVEMLRADLTDPDRETQDTYETEFRIEPDGETRWVQVRGYPVTDESGAVTRFVTLNRDITDRKNRERTLSTFHDATDGLTAAATKAEAADTAVDAARTVLGLDAVGVYLYDETEGVLRPQTATPALADGGDGPGPVPVEPGNHPAWRAFAENTTTAPAPGRLTEREVGTEGDGHAPEDRLGTDPVDEVRVLPMGTHGVLAVGRHGGFTETDLESAHVLAATLEAALNHVQGKRRLAAREEELQATAERADRLERVTRLTREVEAAITDASTRTGIEQAVCDRLTDVDPYEVAWVGETEVGADRLVPQVVAGDVGRGEYTVSLDLSTTGADPHPAVGAWTEDGVHAVDSVVASGPVADWRRRALERGYQSVCAVSLSYDGVTHGVLVVVADRPGVFGERERAAFEQLGTSIGHALTAVERRRALESDDTVELEFRAETPGGLGFARLARDVGCRVHHERTVRRPDGSVSVFYALSGELPGREALADTVETAFRAGVDVSVVSHDGGRAVVEVTANTWFGSTAAEYGAVLRTARGSAAETTISVELPARADVRSFVDRFVEAYPALELVARRQRRENDRSPTELSVSLRDRLTDRQFEALETALAEGYFEWPRESTAEEVAGCLDITQPTLNKHLRTAERETFSLLLDPDDHA